MQPIKVLVVEDEFLVAADLEGKLENLGYIHVGTAKSGPEALELVQSATPDVVIMDIDLVGSEWNGIETAKRIQEIRNLPIIYLTSLTNNATFYAARETRPDDFLNKPISPLTLGRSIELAIERIKGRHEPLPGSASTDYITDGLLFLKDEYGLIKINPLEVQYITADGSSCHLYFSTQKRTLNCNLKTILERFEKVNLANLFFRIHRSHAVAIRHIDAVRGNEVLIGKKRLGIGSSDQYQAFKSVLPVG